MNAVCPKCAAEYRVPDQKIGVKFWCKKCREVIDTGKLAASQPGYVAAVPAATPAKEDEPQQLSAEEKERAELSERRRMRLLRLRAHTRTIARQDVAVPVKDMPTAPVPMQTDVPEEQEPNPPVAEELSAPKPSVTPEPKPDQSDLIKIDDPSAKAFGAAFKKTAIAPKVTQAKPEPQLAPEPELEPEAEQGAQPEPELAVESGPEFEVRQSQAPKPDTAVEPESGLETGLELEAELAPEPGIEPESGLDVKYEIVAEPGLELSAEPEQIAEPAVEIGPEPELPAGLEAEPEAVPLAEVETEASESAVGVADHEVSEAALVEDMVEVEVDLSQMEIVDSVTEPEVAILEAAEEKETEADDVQVDEPLLVADEGDEGIALDEDYEARAEPEDDELEGAFEDDIEGSIAAVQLDDEAQDLTTIALSDEASEVELEDEAGEAEISQAIEEDEPEGEAVTVGDELQAEDEIGITIIPPEAAAEDADAQDEQAALAEEELDDDFSEDDQLVAEDEPRLVANLVDNDAEAEIDLAGFEVDGEDAAAALVAEIPTDDRSIKAYCCSCGARYRMPEEYAGKNNLKCAICESHVEIVPYGESYPEQIEGLEPLVERAELVDDGVGEFGEVTNLDELVGQGVAESAEPLGLVSEVDAAGGEAEAETEKQVDGFALGLDDDDGADAPDVIGSNEPADVEEVEEAVDLEAVEDDADVEVLEPAIDVNDDVSNEAHGASADEDDEYTQAVSDEQVDNNSDNAQDEAVDVVSLDEASEDTEDVQTLEDDLDLDDLEDIEDLEDVVEMDELDDLDDMEDIELGKK